MSSKNSMTSGMNVSQFLTSELDMSIKNYSKNNLHISYLVSAHQQKSTKSKARKMSKEQLAEVLKEYIYRKKNLIYRHRLYLLNLPPQQLASFEFYQGFNYQVINNYMRTSQISKDTFEILPEIEKLFAIDPAMLATPQKSQKLRAKKKKEFDVLFKNFLDNQNDYIRKVKRSIRDLRKIIDNAPGVRESFYVYRGTQAYVNTFAKEDNTSNMDDVFFKYAFRQLELKEGDVIEEKSFVSFSIAPWVAVSFSGPVCCLYRLKITPGAKFPYLIFPLTQTFKEFEVLLNPSKFRVTKITNIKSQYSPSITLRVYDIEFAGSS